MYHQVQMCELLDDTPSAVQPLYLGVLGSRQDLSEKQIREEILFPLLEVFGRPPEQVIVPVEGVTSMYISDWAETLKIPTQIYEADWHRHKRRAKLFRDFRIQKESSCFLIFLNKRSNFNEKLSERLAKQGKRVFTFSYTEKELEEISIEQISEREQPVRQAKRGSKPSIGKEQGLLQLRLSECPGIQFQQINPSVT